jgi:hypothetical protein
MSHYLIHDYKFNEHQSLLIMKCIEDKITNLKSQRELASVKATEQDLKDLEQIHEIFMMVLTA